MHEFDCEITDRKALENVVDGHLSRIICATELEYHIFECFLVKQLFAALLDPRYADIINYLLSSRISSDRTKNDRDRIFYLMKFFVWNNSSLSNLLSKFLKGVFSTRG